MFDSRHDEQHRCHSGRHFRFRKDLNFNNHLHLLFSTWSLFVLSMNKIITKRRGIKGTPLTNITSSVVMYMLGVVVNDVSSAWFI